ncbi:hypothetical protein [Alteribacter keqinensis]|uniref:Sporadically distributed protein, TIGR04141 family n=1 Tax=Alteribacter keqinensis TaxID=2483800 RepID=A0A3M7TT38_9BACI|nr:hypothetical protein [Alteribacter keqinensis]RNA68810.1 hypothetical protein EBO34_02260 [Alteribacter keqinensis]
MLNKNALQVTENAYFYKKIRKFTKAKIKEVFDEISKYKVGYYKLNIVKDKITVNGTEVVFSGCVFKYNRSPDFLKAEQSLSNVETKYAYFLLVEYDGYVAFSKLNVSGIDKLFEDYIEKVGYETMSRMFLSENTRFKKFSVNNMDISDKAIRKKMYEAANLKESLSTLSANKYFVRDMRIVQDNSDVSLALNTSRVGFFSKRKDIDEFSEWVVSIINKIKHYRPSITYLDSFASPINTEIKKLNPRNILFMINDLFEEESQFYLKLDNGRTRNINVNLMEKIERSFELTKINTSAVKVNTNIDNSLKLIKNKKSFSIRSNKLRKIHFKLNDGVEHNLLNYLNENQNFLVLFDDINIVYWANTLFKDNALLSNIENFLDVFLEFPELKDITSEKGPTDNTTLKAFERNSLFNFIELKLANNSNFIFCDDLGDEWADYISLDDNKICFYHAKYHEPSLSASAFHEVVSQAQKNLGNIYVTEDSLNRKRDSWGNPYGKTEIKRLIKGTNIEEGIEAYKSTLKAPNSFKEIVLVINFISKKQLQEELVKLKDGQSTKYQVVQIFWLISSLVSLCKEAGLNVYITCLP